MNDQISSMNRSLEGMLIKGIQLSKEVKKNDKYCESCKIDLWISFFFDGTGNNYGNDFNVEKGIF